MKTSYFFSQDKNAELYGLLQRQINRTRSILSTGIDNVKHHYHLIVILHLVADYYIISE